MKKLVTLASFVAVAFFGMPAFGQGGECSGGLCGTPNQSGGGGCGCGCGCGSVLVAMTDRGDTYQFADDFDGDGIEDEFDNCPFTSNYAQTDGDADTVGDACDSCISVSDPQQSDVDGDGLGDMCDTDLDGDGWDNSLDNCVRMPNSAQVNTDGDIMGDACDADDDNDGIEDLLDDCRLGIAGQDVCDDDADGDGIESGNDNCPFIYNPQLDTNGLQLDVDGDGAGDLCDLDIDGDGIDNFADNCMDVSNPSQLDADMDGVGDAGNWTGGAESCDPNECYVIGGDAPNCLDPNTAFAIYLTLVGERVEDAFQVGSDVTVALFSNRLGQQHNWTARFQDMPGSSNISLANAQGSGATAPASPHVTNNLGNISFTPDQPGEYIIKVTASLPGDDALGPNTASYTIVAEVEGDPQGGCAATGASAGGLAALALGLMVAVRRRKK